MAHAVRGFSLLLVYSGGFSAACLICHFNAPVRRFNAWGYPYTAAVPLVLCPLFMALLRGVVPCSVAFRLRVALPACRRPCSPVALPGGGLLRRCGLGGLRRLLRRARLSAKVAGKVSGKVAGIVAPLCAKVAGKVAVKVASTCAKVARFTPKS